MMSDLASGGGSRPHLDRAHPALLGPRHLGERPHPANWGIGIRHTRSFTYSKSPASWLQFSRLRAPCQRGERGNWIIFGWILPIIAGVDCWWYDIPDQATEVLWPSARFGPLRCSA